MRNQLFKSMWILVLISFGVGCASIIKGGGSQSVNLTSDPPGAKCAIFDNATGNNIANTTTPNIVPLKRGNGYFKYAKYNINCSMDNNTSQDGIVEGYINGWYLGGNLIFGGLIGYFIVDPATGAMWNLEPDTVVVNFNDPKKSVLTKIANTDSTSPTDVK